MPRRHYNVRRRGKLSGRQGDGLATDLLKKLAIELTPALASIAAPAAKEAGEWIGSKVKQMRGGSNRLTGEMPHNRGGAAFLAGLPPSVERKMANLSIKKRRPMIQ